MYLPKLAPIPSLALLVILAPSLAGQAVDAAAGEGPRLKPPRITQEMIVHQVLDLQQIRAHGLRMFATPFNRFDGFGDGPMNPSNTRDPGGRPTLQNNGMFLRINGLDSQTCMECHSVLSSATVPFRFGIAGVGGANNNAMFKPANIDVGDAGGHGFASFDGRFINPPFLLGAGGVELAGKEMTKALQALKEYARRHPNHWVSLVAKGVDFGQIRFANGAFDTSRVVGIEPDLVVRPFGRKGELATTRAFDREAMMFHLGMQPVEVVGENVDADHDGVVNEVLVGELSALAIFNTTLPRPIDGPSTPESRRGEQHFRRIGCADCHVPFLDTESPILTHSFPEVETDPSANVYYAVNLRGGSANFEGVPHHGVGIRVPLFSDLKRHDMGPKLAESFNPRLDSLFITARLWGVADTAPYLHDGRALTLTDAILTHGGEAQQVRDRFAALAEYEKNELLAFLRTLHTPEHVAEDLKVPGQ